MKKLKHISLAFIAVCASALAVYATDYLFFHRNGKVIQQIPAGSVERIVKGNDGRLSAVDNEDNALYTFAAEEVDSITFTAPLPKADLLDVVFNADGTATDISPMKFTVERGGNATTEWSDAFNRYAARITGNNWGDSNVAENFFRINYDGNQAFKDGLADGHTLEALFMPEYSGSPMPKPKSSPPTKPAAQVS